MQIDRPAIERKVLALMEHWRELLKSDARQLLREALDGPIRFTPNGTYYSVEGKLRIGTIIEGAIGSSPFYGAPGGT